MGKVPTMQEDKGSWNVFMPMPICFRLERAASKGGTVSYHIDIKSRSVLLNDTHHPREKWAIELPRSIYTGATVCQDAVSFQSPSQNRSKMTRR